MTTSLIGQVNAANGVSAADPAGRLLWSRHWAALRRVAAPEVVRRHLDMIAAGSEHLPHGMVLTQQKHAARVAAVPPRSVPRC